jgi:hypothetical protein
LDDDDDDDAVIPPAGLIIFRVCVCVCVDDNPPEENLMRKRQIFSFIRVGF